MIQKAMLVMLCAVLLAGCAGKRINILEQQVAVNGVEIKMMVSCMKELGEIMKAELELHNMHAKAICAVDERLTEHESDFKIHKSTMTTKQVKGVYDDSQHQKKAEK